MDNRFREINTDLARLEERARSAAQVKKRLTDLERRKRDLTALSLRLHRRLSREEADVERLDRPSLAERFVSLFSRKRKRRQAEIADVQAAREKQEDARYRLGRLQKEIDHTRLELDQFATLDTQRRDLIAEKETLLAALDDDRARRFQELVRKENDARNAFEEVKKTAETANKISVLLARASTALKEAGAWGTADVLGGGTLAFIEKRQAIDKARIFVAEARPLMENLQELIDSIGESVDLPDPSLGGFWSFADLLLDNFVLDLVIYRKIRNAAGQIRDSHQRIKGIRAVLLDARQKADDDGQQAARARSAFVRGIE